MGLELVSIEGSPRDMGGRHGELLADGARAMCEARIDLCLRAATSLSRNDLLALAGQSLPVFADFAPQTYAEFRGIAEGAGLSEEELLIGNGYTDFVDLVGQQAAGPPECTAFQVAPSSSRDGRSYLGQTWDMNASAYPHVVAFRRLPNAGPASITMTTAGCLSLVGVNESGIAIGNTNLVPHDAGSGIMYLALIHTVLAQKSFDDAVRVISDAPRMSGHFYYLGGPDGELLGIETTGKRHALVKPNDAGILAHANHYTDRQLAAYVGQGEPTANSAAREARMWRLLNAGVGQHDLATLAEVLSDHEAPICRHEQPGDEARTCSAAIICPSKRRLRMVKGYPCQEKMVEAAVA
jgi:isopenicillin-N N-acyltransferase-like protein